MRENKLTSDLLRGHTDTMILRLLSEADRYGYEMVKLIAERSGGEYELKEATMYSSVRRLEADGEIEWYWGDESQGGRRKYFRITEKGKVNEFVIQTGEDPHAINARLLGHKIVGGFPLKKFYPELGNAALWCCTELTSRTQIDTAVGHVADSERSLGSREETPQEVAR
jgi:PadR family transcriptional regulator, regulatory protein PadR